MDTAFTQIRSILITTPARWTQLVSLLPEDLLTRVPEPGQWSALECLQHMIDVEYVFQTRLAAFLAGKDFPAFDPDAEGSQGQSARPAELAAAFANLRQASLLALEKITPADYPRGARHPELGPVTLEQMLHEWAAHDLNHTIQAERALMQPFIQGCGPWQTYFSEHWVGANP